MPRRGPVGLMLQHRRIGPRHLELRRRMETRSVFDLTFTVDAQTPTTPLTLAIDQP